MFCQEPELLAAHFARKQEALQQHIRKIASNDGWKQALNEIRSNCGAFVLWRRTDCAGSRFLAPVVYEMSHEDEKAPVVFFEVNVDACPEATAHYNIDLTPAFTAFHHGKLVSTSHGVSQRALHEFYGELCGEIDSCAKCGRQDRLRFMSRAERVIHSGVCVDAGSRIPSGLCALDLDPFNHSSLDSMEFRAKYLLQKLERQANHDDIDPRLFAHMEHVLEFLRAHHDEGLHVDRFAQVAQEWLAEHVQRHPSCWSKDLFKARDKCVRTAICRRAARAEVWFLQNLSATSSSTMACGTHDKLLWEQFRATLEALQERTVCARQCSSCSLPCWHLRRHSGPCECGTDHRCHCMSPHGQCEGFAGHEGVLHQFPIPTPPQPRLLPTLAPSVVPSATAFTLSELPTLPAMATVAATARAHGPACHTNLSTMTIDELRNSWKGSDGNADSSCSICFEPLGASAEELYCKHAFHANCIHWWINRKKHWPLCRFPIDSECCSRVEQSATMLAIRSGQAAPASMSPATSVFGRNRRSSSVPNSQRAAPASSTHVRPPRSPSNASNLRSASNATHTRTRRRRQGG